ncbi:MAG: VOC family protein, partial [Gammaproteobacteria bacterium]|nr:VOC family protein [Gammaproteobacteria bacterium]
IPVRNVKAAQAYYHEVFGFDIGWELPSGELGAVSKGEIVFFLRLKESGFDAITQWVFCEDLESVYQQLQSASANITEPIQTKPWNLRQFAVEDQDGNVFYFHAG